MANPVSIKRSLLVNFLLVIVLLSSAITAITFVGNRRAVRDLTANLISQSIDHTESKLEIFFKPVIRDLMLARSWGMQGLLKTDNPEYMRQLFIPMIKELKPVSSLMVADERGREFMLLKTGVSWFNRLSKVEKWRSKVRIFKWRNGEKPLASWKNLVYDPRKRPWYIGAVNELRKYGPMTDKSDANFYLHWTKPYNFLTTNEPGITASIYFKAHDGVQRVIGFDVSLNDISKYTMNLKVSENGKVFVLNYDDLKLVGLPRSKTPLTQAEINEQLLKYPDKLKDPLISNAFKAYTRKSDYSRGPVRFSSNGQVWLGEFRQFRLSENRALWIAALVPETDIIGDQSLLRIWIFVITITAMLIAAFRAYILARRYSKPIDFLMIQSERISRGLLYKGDTVDSGISEIQRLAEAHEKMRIALKSLLKLEGDLQLARQIQQNTFPKDLPLLEGFDIDAWSQPAEETGGDTYDIIGYCYDEQKKGIVLTNDKPDYTFLLMADATGHGIGPALSANEVRSMLRMAVRTGVKIEQIAAHINEQLFQDLHAGRFITAWLCELEIATAKLTYFSAGQAPMLHFHSKTGEFTSLEADSAPFGILSELNVQLPEVPVLEHGDIFIVISDGVYEATDAKGNQFGLDRVMDIIKTSADLSSSKILLRIRHELDNFTGDFPANDDRTAILVKRH
ncbi:hypothetical protein MNBD_GAMMA12-3746 [hydrothermal vent metagenome]|uniref:PPM-type phosphatase domain-containing protein n=1 Tax=hydrothermal vent metagenome TaxID=652676 RepID=A0A3B0YE82_9ZZZZ